jgi:hypothetical protein
MAQAPSLLYLVWRHVSPTTIRVPAKIHPRSSGLGGLELSNVRITSAMQLVQLILNSAVNCSSVGHVVYRAKPHDTCSC